MITMIRWLGYLAFELLLLCLQLLIINLLPLPGNLLQAIWIAAPLLILLNRFHLALGLAGGFYFFLELWSGAPFGLMLASGMATLIGLEKLYRVVLTNRSVYSALALAAAGAGLNRLLLAAGLLVFGQTASFRIGASLVLWGAEIIFTVIITGVAYLFLYGIKGQPAG